MIARDRGFWRGELLDDRVQIAVRVRVDRRQYCGGMGPLSAGSPQGFRTSDLFLAGVSVQLGVRL